MINQLASIYSSKIDIRVHLFPLPYNQGSFLVAQACVASGIIQKSSRTVLECLQLMFDNQKDIKTKAMNTHTVPQVIDDLVDLISGNMSVSKDALAKQMVQELEGGASSYAVTKSDWKFGTSMGVFATPAVFVNGVQLFGFDSNGGGHAEGDLASMNVSDWRKVLDEIVASNGVFLDEL